MILTEEQRVLRRQLEQVSVMGIRAILYFQGVTDKGDNFWKFTQNCYGERAIHLWSQVFNSYHNDPTHYKNLFDDDQLASLDTSFETENVELRIIHAAGFNSKASFEEWREVIINFRNKYCAHREYTMGEILFPKLEHAILMFKELRILLKETVDLEAHACTHEEIHSLQVYYDDETNEALEEDCLNDLHQIQFF